LRILLVVILLSGCASREAPSSASAAPLASNPIGNFGASLIRIPGQMVKDIGKGAIQIVASTIGKNAHFVPNGINALSPENPLLIAMNTLPIKPPFHSIIGVAGSPKAPLEKTSDTVVPYWIAHLDGARSEKIVPYPHTAMFVKPEATDVSSAKPKSDDKPG
jgi:hypothetical protein